MVIFSLVKRRWSEARDEFERLTKQKVSKSNFLGIYATAHTKVFTPENIQAAFRVTGVVPYNPDVVTSEMMAPSLETSIHGYLPVPVPSPVRIISQLILDRVEENWKSAEHKSTPSATAPATPSRSPIHTALRKLSSTSASFLTTTTPLHSTSIPPHLNTIVISPEQPDRNRQLMEQETHTEAEQRMQEALREAETRDGRHKAALIGTQAFGVLAEMYVDRSHRQVEVQEGKPKKTKRLFSDGLPRLLDCDIVFDQVDKYEERVERETAEKEHRKALREAHSIVLEDWKKKEDERKERNTKKREQHHAALRVWEAERDRARIAKERARWAKPKLGKLEAAIPRPKKGQDLEDDEDEEDEEDDMDID